MEGAGGWPERTFGLSALFLPVWRGVCVPFGCILIHSNHRERERERETRKWGERAQGRMMSMFRAVASRASKSSHALTSWSRQKRGVEIEQERGRTASFYKQQQVLAVSEKGGRGGRVARAASWLVWGCLSPVPPLLSPCLPRLPRDVISWPTAFSPGRPAAASSSFSLSTSPPRVLINVVLWRRQEASRRGKARQNRREEREEREDKLDGGKGKENGKGEKMTGVRSHGCNSTQKKRAVGKTVNIL